MQMDQRGGRPEAEAVDLTLSLAVGGSTRPKADDVTQQIVLLAVKDLYKSNRTGSTRDQIREHIAQRIFRGMVPEPEDAFTWVVDSHLLDLVEDTSIQMVEHVFRVRDASATSRNPT
ncbi:hypothetical protein KP509_32G031200 [Ceratopteris richardii]|uniref:Uncharacterized protein n=1 Tax=Ceratopteris richardii TaxID=49495 RepID=A0A8T2QTS3_CERRI|nr:hypothetical protein KP509_32G031200 [Ceratopteris richardii]